MERSARSLQPTFHALAEQSWRRPADIALRETVGRLGREREAQMMLATGGLTPPPAAIWALSLLVSAVAMLGWRGSITGSPTPLPPPACPTARAEKPLVKGFAPPLAGRQAPARSARVDFPHITAWRCRNCSTAGARRQ